MRILFVRHGDPNYQLDCLTEEGHRQAAAAAQRLRSEGISEIYASSCGRAVETAGYTARLLGLSVKQLSYMREISWGGEDIPEKGHPWTLGSRMIEEGFDFYSDDWRAHPYFRGNAATDCYDMIAPNIDRFLADHGYIHDGPRFLCRGGTDKTIALFSHGGSGACALSHILALPFPYVSAVLPYDFTSVTVVRFPVDEGKYVHPRLELFNDHAHMTRAGDGPAIQRVSSDKL